MLVNSFYGIDGNHYPKMFFKKFINNFFSRNFRVFGALEVPTKISESL